MKMKKFVCILILICVVLGAAFAQAKPATPAPAPAPAKPAAAPAKVNAIGLDVFQLVKGTIESDSDKDVSVFYIFVGYERHIAPHFSIGADLDMGFLTVKVLDKKYESKYFSIAADGRYYPLSVNFDKLFLGATLGYSQLENDGSTKAENGGFTGLNASLKMGYKVLTEKGFYLEPTLAYAIDKRNTDGEWNCGLRLGWAF
jgi:hypothetical protein